jgi:hypothetical protein
VYKRQRGLGDVYKRQVENSALRVKLVRALSSRWFFLHRVVFDLSSSV